MESKHVFYAGYTLSCFNLINVASLKWLIGQKISKVLQRTGMVPLLPMMALFLEIQPAVKLSIHW